MAHKRQPHLDVSLPPFLPPLPSLKVNKIFKQNGKLMKDERTSLQYWVFLSKNKIKLFIFLNVVFPELALVHKRRAGRFNGKAVSFFEEGTGEEPSFIASL